MSRRRWRQERGLLALALVVLASQGCGEGPAPVDSSTTEATVTGVVKVRGVPADSGEVVFNPSNHLRIVPSKVAPIGPDGTFKITTYTGGNEVSFRGDVASKNRGVGLIKEYVDVQRGENKAEFDLMGQGHGPS